VAVPLVSSINSCCASNLPQAGSVDQADSKRGAAPVIGRAAKRAKKKKAGPFSHNRLLASIGKVVPCRKWGGWSGAGGDFEKGVYGLQLSNQQPAASALAI
jgi:hypothetical protein